MWFVYIYIYFHSPPVSSPSLSLSHSRPAKQFYLNPNASPNVGNSQNQPIKRKEERYFNRVNEDVMMEEVWAIGNNAFHQLDFDVETATATATSTDVNANDGIEDEPRDLETYTRVLSARRSGVEWVRGDWFGSVGLLTFFFFSSFAFFPPFFSLSLSLSTAVYFVYFCGFSVWFFFFFRGSPVETGADGCALCMCECVCIY